MAMNVKITVIYDVAPCSLVETVRSFGGVVMLEEVSISETSVNFYQIARRNNPADIHIRTVLHGFTNKHVY
jgi:hypothetical protein